MSKPSAAPEDLHSVFEGLHQAASAAAGGLDDFGDTTYHEALKRLLAAQSESRTITAQGLARGRQSMVGGLIGRLLSEAQWKQMPEVLGHRIESPIVIAGLPRTGTTALHELLATDPQFQTLAFWLGNAPMPRPPREQWERMPAFQQTAAFIEEFYAQAPVARAMHLMTAEMPEEDRTLLLQDFAHLWYMECSRVPAYELWVERHDPSVAYRRFADNLRLVGSRDTGKRWVLKDPVHLLFMDTLLAQFPDARVIQTHRDPSKSIPSLSSLVAQLRLYFEGPDSDSKVIGPRKVEQWSYALEHTAQVRERRPDQFFDVHQTELIARPMEVIGRLYDFLGLKLGDEVRKRMLAWLAHNRSRPHGQHHYTPETFGLTEAGIRQSFDAYITRYDVARDGAEFVIDGGLTCQ